MYSFPNLVPLPAAQVARIAGRLGQHSFDRLHGPFPTSLIKSKAAEVVQRSAQRYCGILDGSVARTYT